jgi:hypothetical protein
MGIGLTVGFITIVHSSTIQLSLSGLPQSYNSRLTLYHDNSAVTVSTATALLASLANTILVAAELQVPFLFPWLPTPSLNYSTQLTGLTTENSEVYDLWTDCREDSAFGIGCLGITRETGTLRPRPCTLPSNVYSTACTSQYFKQSNISCQQRTCISTKTIHL